MGQRRGSGTQKVGREVSGGRQPRAGAQSPALAGGDLRGEPHGGRDAEALDQAVARGADVGVPGPRHPQEHHRETIQTKGVGTDECTHQGTPETLFGSLKNDPKKHKILPLGYLILNKICLFVIR